jgi:murein DD-endopeptidase MepM/ murein hydrolase activator NlpD
MKIAVPAIQPASRSARAPAVAVRYPRVSRRQPRSLEETLIAVGIVPRGGLRRPRGLLRRWFASEAMLLAGVNAVSSLALVTLAMTMTVIGMQLVVALNLAATLYVILNDGLPYAGLGLLVGGLAKVFQTSVTHRNDRFGKLMGYGTSAILVAGGFWLEVKLGYANFTPWMFKPILFVAGGDLAARVRVIDKALIAYFEPALVAVIGFLLAAKQIKTSVQAGRHRVRGYLALVGLAASVGALGIGLYAGHRHYVSQGSSDIGLYAIGGDSLSENAHAFGSLFAPGVRCRVSDVYGVRADPMNSKRMEDHMGVDIAVARGTPIHAMATGQVILAKFDSGLGNMVALQVAGVHQPTLVAGHMEKFAVSAGDFVSRGDLIGFAGSTGRSTGPHVHLQVCPDASIRRGGLACGRAENPYEVWPTLAALARMSCNDGPEIY